MKGIRNGKQDVWHLLPDMWNFFQKRGDEVRYNEHMRIYLVVFSAFANVDYCK